MKECNVEIEAVPEAQAKKMTAENRHGYLWPTGLYVLLDNSRSVLESRAEVDELIEQLKQGADKLWPKA